MNYTSVNLYRKLIDHALTEGLTLADFQDLLTPVSALDQIRAVPAEQFFALHEQLAKRLGPGFAVRVGQEMKMDDYGVLGLSWKTCSRAGEIFERSERYFHLLSNTYLFQVETDGPLSHIHLHREASRQGVAFSNEATFSATVVVLQAMTETNLQPVEVAFQHAAPADRTDHDRLFACPVHFDQPHNVMTYRTAELNIRTAKADQSIHHFLMERVEEEKQGMEVSALKLAIDVERLIQEALPSGIPGIAQISEHLGMSSRTLTRRLREKGLTFRQLVTQTQQQLASELLRNSSQTMGEIAFQTGFSEQSAFSRAFKRWTGQAPLDYRNLR